MIPLCCSPKSGQQAMKKGARFDESRKIFYIDNRHKRSNFKPWLPRYYRPSFNNKNNDVLKIYYCPYSSPARKFRDLIGKDKFFLLKEKINYVSGGVCQYCGKIDNLWLICLYHSYPINDNKLHQELKNFMGACPSCAKMALGYSKDKEILMKLNKWEDDKAEKYIIENIKKNQRVFEEYEVNFEEKIKSFIGDKNEKKYR